MVELSTSEPGSKKRAGVQRMIKHPLKVDMTPMVDLGFLLITFFVMTTEMSKPTVMPLYMPKDSVDNPTELARSNALTVLVGDGKIYCYHGDWDIALRTNSITETKLAGKDDLRQTITDKQKALDISQRQKEGRDGLMLLIKPGSAADYKTVINVLDEVAINIVKKYAILKLEEPEKRWLHEHN